MIAEADWVVVVLSRWVHLVFAGLLLGGTFFVYALLPRGVRELDESARTGVLARTQRGFKMLVHPCILFLLLSGTYNAVVNWGAYRKNMPLTHALFGPHLALGLLIFGILLVIQAGRTPRVVSRTWLGVCLLLLFVTFAVASGLKYAREHPHDHPNGRSPGASLAGQQTTSYMIG